jgi:hypothetical protein
MSYFDQLMNRANLEPAETDETMGTLEITELGDVVGGAAQADPGTESPAVEISALKYDLNFGCGK